MVDRVELLGVIANRIHLSGAQATQFNNQLNKVLAIVCAELSLEDARELSGRERSELESALRGILTFADLKKVSKRWEPRRKIDGDISQTDIANGLVELLYDKRAPYVPISITLGQARALSDRDKADLIERITRVAPVGDLKKVAKKWDRRNQALASAGRAKLVAGLLSLLAGETNPM